MQTILILLTKTLGLIHFSLRNENKLDMAAIKWLNFVYFRRGQFQNEKLIYFCKKNFYFKSIFSLNFLVCGALAVDFQIHVQVKKYFFTWTVEKPQQLKTDVVLEQDLELVPSGHGAQPTTWKLVISFQGI